MNRIEYTGKDVGTMREVLYKNRTSAKNKRRVFFVSEKSENDDTLTHIYRIFIYAAGGKVEKISDVPAPTFFITKHRDTKTKEEKFLFRVKGLFYLAQEGHLTAIHFCHSLRIDIIRKPEITLF